MFGSDMLEVGVGLGLLFLLMSLICTAVREAIEGILKSRAKDLEQGIRGLLKDEEGAGLTKDLFDHPLLYGLFNGSYNPKDLSRNPIRSKRMGLIAGRKLPSYIPASLFAEALLDRVVRGPVSVDNKAGANAGQGANAAQGAGVVISIESLRASAATIQNDHVQRAVLSAIDMAQGDLDKVRANIENWYNGTMDRVSGWYRRRTQTILFFIGLGAAAALNVDAITIAKRLNNDKALRQAAVAQAGAVVRGQGANGQGANAGQGANGQGANGQGALKTPIESLQERTYTQLRTNLDEIGFPVGWYVKGSPWKDWSNFRLVPAPQACGRPEADQNGRPAATAPDECKNFRPPDSLSGSRSGSAGSSQRSPSCSGRRSGSMS